MSVALSRNYVIIGKMGSGKTEAAQYLVDNYGYACYIHSLPIKTAATAIWGNQMRVDREKGLALGEWVQTFDPGALAKRNIDRIHRELEKGTPMPIVVEAPRYPNDLIPYMELGYRVLEISTADFTRVDRLQRAGHGRLTDMSQLEHPSETALDDRIMYPRDRTIHNDGPVEDMYEAIDTMMKQEDARV